ncbi:MAG: hypothetical protein FD169_2210 [Bacillota bacterium]|nr:MAG: hypothetical protein FD169_2210 [Bacillota bacterium]
MPYLCSSPFDFFSEVPIYSSIDPNKKSLKHPLKWLSSEDYLLTEMEIEEKVKKIK